MKRFGFDWENNRALKFDDYFRFPFILNMEPYTVDSVNRRESFISSNDLMTNVAGETKLFRRSSSVMSHSGSTVPTINYELIGIVIHSGQANAGHYYSLIKDTRSDQSDTDNIWYRFNDATVDEIQLTEQVLEEECFGGTYRIQKDNVTQKTEERTRSWNAYMLIYRCIEPTKLLPPPSISSTSSSDVSASRSRRRRYSKQRDSLSQLTDLFKESEKHDLFSSKRPIVPSRVHSCVKEENLEFVKNRDIYCEDYFDFIYRLCNVCLESDHSPTLFELCTRLAVHFLFYSHLRTHRRLRKSFTKWHDFLKALFMKNPPSCSMFFDALMKDNNKNLKSYLLECPSDDVRQCLQEICERAVAASYTHETAQPSFQSMKKFIEACVSLLDRAVIEQVKQSQSYFQFIINYSRMDQQSMSFLLFLNAFPRLMNFLLGDNVESRRWSSSQAKDFGNIHEILSTLAFAFMFQTEKSDKKTSEKIDEMKNYYYGTESNRYLREVCYAFQEIPSTQLQQTLQLMETLATDNKLFSEKFIRVILRSIAQSNYYDLKSVFQLLINILSISDALQVQRLQIAFEGNRESESSDATVSSEGLYEFIRINIDSDERRAYQGLKLIPALSQKSTTCRDYFHSTAASWTAAINWLKQCMQSNSQPAAPYNSSNEDNRSASLQRTRSVLFTLEQAQTILHQKIPSMENASSIGTSSVESMDINNDRCSSPSKFAPMET